MKLVGETFLTKRKYRFVSKTVLKGNFKMNKTEVSNLFLMKIIKGNKLSALG